MHRWLRDDDRRAWQGRLKADAGFEGALGVRALDGAGDAVEAVARRVLRRRRQRRRDQLGRVAPVAWRDVEREMSARHLAFGSSRCAAIEIARIVDQELYTNAVST